MRSSVKSVMCGVALACGLLGATSAWAATACSDKIGESAAQTQVLSNGFGFNVANTRNQTSDISADNVATLTLALTHVAAGSKEKRGTPAVTQQVVYASEARELVAFNRASGCEYWRFAAADRSSLLLGNNIIRQSSIQYLPAQGTQPPLVLAGDAYANMYAVDARTGKKVWSAFVGVDTAYSWVTGSPVIFEGTMYLPIASKEVVTTVLNVLTPCCKSHGALQALDPYTGKIKWTYHTVTNASYDAKTGFYGPAGMSLWGTPAIDAANRAVIIGTGQNLSLPTTTNEDSIISLDLATGKVRWVFQAQANDSWNGACEAPAYLGLSGRCAPKQGRDLDFGAPPIVVNLPGGKPAILAGGKNGVAYALEPKTGAVIWSQQLGAGGKLGGIHWGMAVDATRVYAAVTDLDAGKAVVPVAGATPGIYALDLLTGKRLWERHFRHTYNGADYDSLFSAALSVSRDVLFAANLNGEVLALRTSTGEELWRFNTAIAVKDVNTGAAGQGGTVDAMGAVPVGRELYVNSGYATFGNVNAWMAGPGNALMVFRLP
jgi:polyvinyl alcohol dehydrogenase (cytochrome)